MDQVDRAQIEEEADRAAALRARKCAPAGDWWEISATHCEAEYCGAEIPMARRRAIPGVRLCVECQDIQERREHRRLV